MDVPDRLAADLGIRVDETLVPDHWPDGLWVAAQRRIILRRGLDYVTRRCVLAHEIGHAWHSHIKTGVDWLDDRMEKEADEYAATLLIHPDHYAEIEHTYGHQPEGIAWYLDVLPHLIPIWQQAHPNNDIHQPAM